MKPFEWDSQRAERTGIAEAVFCAGKATADLDAIIAHNISVNNCIFLTRLSAQQFATLSHAHQAKLDFDPSSNTAILLTDAVSRNEQDNNLKPGVCIVAAGTSDISVAREAARTLQFNGYAAPLICDVGVAGLWRLTEKLPEIQKHKIIIAVAGMEGALFSVLAGLIHAPIIAVPSPVGYGVSAGGKAALESALASCAPGIVTVNIGNGFGAAVAAIKTLNMFEN
ncbi:circadian phase modifier CpmA (plasmid) [Saccharobesus litoralis]|uniref:Circadian phase modifier CpmA n=1 Tax=Saccharobesus litoralis TaxID=2172099 RepID=A0A2S0VYB5_9ALTE|nr:nickel pincer cofactor biosynthesis protein LarB [Saccharobesus litoralis]AWB69217.1 circadian phase modifier CpmA [Saccharobesus litoralis]